MAEIKMALSQSIRGEVRQMEVGDIIAFPGSRAGSVKTIVSLVGFELQRRYSCHSNRDNHTIEVTRLA